MPRTLKKDRWRNAPNLPKTKEAEQNYYDSCVPDTLKIRFEHFNHRKKDNEKN